MRYKNKQGFTLVELIAVIVVVGILAGAVASRALPNTTLQLQAGRDVVISALFLAQQKASAQSDLIAVVTSADAVDVRQDSNGNGNFEASESIRVAGSSFPMTLPGGVALASQQIQYDRLGRTSATSIQLYKAGQTLTISISGTGYAY